MSGVPSKLNVNMAVTCSALLGLGDDLPPVNREIIGAGICDLCGEHADALKLFDRAPAVGVCYCQKCAPGRETDEDWPNEKAHLRAGDGATREGRLP